MANTNWGGADEQFSSCDYTYDVPINGTGASTTGNIYGIYDMSGGLWDIVMGNYDRRSGKNAEFNSGYSGQLESGEIFAGKDWLDDKYYNIYTSKDMMTACNGKPCISHGFFETQGWWQSCFHQSVTEEKPWIVRGGSYSDGIGIFDYEIIDGSVQLINYPVTYGFTTFRLALT